MLFWDFTALCEGHTRFLCSASREPRTSDFCISPHYMKAIRRFLFNEPIFGSDGDSESVDEQRAEDSGSGESETDSSSDPDSEDSGSAAFAQRVHPAEQLPQQGADFSGAMSSGPAKGRRVI